MIEVGNYDLVAAFEIGGDGVFREVAGGIGGQKGEREEESEQTGARSTVYWLITPMKILFCRCPDIDNPVPGVFAGRQDAGVLLR